MILKSYSNNHHLSLKPYRKKTLLETLPGPVQDHDPLQNYIHSKNYHHCITSTLIVHVAVVFGGRLAGHRPTILCSHWYQNNKSLVKNKNICTTRSHTFSHQLQINPALKSVIDSWWHTHLVTCWYCVTATVWTILWRKWKLWSPFSVLYGF